MPSTRITKTNIDRDTLAGMQVTAAAAGISTAELIDKMYINYIRTLNATAPTETPPQTKQS